MKTAACTTQAVNETTLLKETILVFKLEALSHFLARKLFLFYDSEK